MYTQYSLPVIHPAFELLKRSAKILHFIAAAIISMAALHQWQAHGGNKIVCGMLFIIALDIFILVFFTGEILTETPRLNILFRLIESIVLLGVSFLFFKDGHIFLGLIDLIASLGYFLLMHREVRVIKQENVNIRSTGISLPSLLKDAELSWDEVKNIIPKYHSIIIETIRNKKIELDLRKNLRIDELEKIDSFCKQHLVG